MPARAEAHTPDLCIVMLDLDEMLHMLGVEKKVTVQKVCTRARNEIEARDALARIWSDPSRSAELLDQLAVKNANLFEFEKTLEEKEDIPEIVMTVRS
jgi:hypothetical protein